MDSNQRSKQNNQTDNGANEQWNQNAKGVTRDNASEQRASSGAVAGAATGAGTGMARGDRHDPAQDQLATTGAQQGTIDSHQRVMEQHSDAWGKLDQPLGNRQRDGSAAMGEDVANRQGKTRTADTPQPPATTQPVPQGGTPARDPAVVPGTDDKEARGTEAGVPGVQHGDIYGNRQAVDENRADTQDASASKIQQRTDRHGTPTGETPREVPVDKIHQSNDLAGGLPRSPGGTGPRTEGAGYQTGGSMAAEPHPVHESNDAAGGYPRSPGGANKLAGDKKMDDDTGFSRG